MKTFRDASKLSTSKPSRRQVIQAASGLALGLSTPFVRNASAADPQIVIRDAGGPVGAIFKTVFYEPFKAATGVNVVGVTSDSEMSGLIKAMVEAKTYTWDMAIMLYAQSLALSNIGALEPMPAAGKNVGQIPQQFRSEFIVGDAVVGSALAYRTDRVKKKPQGWKDFFDISGLPGRRAVRKHAFDTLEFALLADGVPPNQIYPLDLDRAFKVLDRIKGSNPIWWTTGSQVTQILASGEADMLAGFGNRALLAKAAGAPVEVVWNGGIWTFEGWGVLKGTPNAKLCHEFIEFASDASRQAAWAPKVGLGPTNPNAMQFIDRDAVNLPSNPENLKVMVQMDPVYWQKNQTQVLERFNAWLVS